MLDGARGLHTSFAKAVKAPVPSFLLGKEKRKTTLLDTLQSVKKPRLLQRKKEKKRKKKSCPFPFLLFFFLLPYWTTWGGMCLTVVPERFPPNDFRHF